MTPPYDEDTRKPQSCLWHGTLVVVGIYIVLSPYRFSLRTKTKKIKSDVLPSPCEYNLDFGQFVVVTKPLAM